MKPTIAERYLILAYRIIPSKVPMMKLQIIEATEISIVIPNP